MANIVEIVIRAKNEAGKAFSEVDAQSHTLGKQLSKVGTVGTAAMAAVGVASIAMSVKFQSTMTMLQTQAGVSKSALKGLETGVLNLAGKVGFSPDSLGQALYHIESSFQSVGISGPKALALLKVAAQGAATGHADLVDVTNALDAAIASGIPGVKNYQQAMGVLNATVGAGDMKMQDLADALGSGVLATVKGFGLTIKDVGAALATFGDNNIRGAHAGTQLRMSVMALAVPAKAGQAQLAAWGYNANRLATDMRQGGLLKALDDLHGMFVKNGVTAKQQGDVITNMFGKKAGAGLNVLMDQLGRVQSKYPDLTRGANGFGAAVDATNQTAAQKYKDLKAQLDATAITLGNKLLPVVTDLLNFTQRHISGIEKLAATLGAIAVASKTVQVIKVGFQIAKQAGSWIGKILSGTTTEIGASGMQKAGDTMVAAASAMQKAADTMVGADAGAGAGAAGAGAAGAGAAAGTGALAAGSRILPRVASKLPFVGEAASKALAGTDPALYGLMLSGDQSSSTPGLGKLIKANTAVQEIMKNAIGTTQQQAQKLIGLYESHQWSKITSMGYDPSVIGTILKATGAIDGLGKSVRSTPKEIKLKGNITDLQSKLKTAIQQLNDPNVTKTRRAAIEADIGSLERQIAKAKADLAKLNGMTATTYVVTNSENYTYNHNVRPRRGSGGIVGAATGGVRNALTMVGEYGRELVDFSSHRVYSNPDTERMMSRGGAQRVEVVVSYHPSVSRGLGPGLLRDLRYTVQTVGGGNVQAAFGAGS